MDLETLKNVIRIFESSSLGELEVEEADTRFFLKKEAYVAPQSQTLQMAPGMQPMPPLTFSTPVQMQPTAAPQPAPTQTAGAADPNEDDKCVTINSPMIGVFYVAPAPDQPPYVAVGDTVKKGQTICIVEAMKLMNEVTAEFSGRIVKVLVENGEPVEYGQPLFSVEPL